MQIHNDSVQSGSIVVPWALDPLKDDLDLELHGCGCGGDCDSCNCSGECHCGGGDDSGYCSAGDGGDAEDHDDSAGNPHTAPDLNIDVPTLNELINAPMEPEKPQSTAEEMIENIKESLSVEIGEFTCEPSGGGIECTSDDDETISIDVRPDLDDGEVEINVGYEKKF